MELDEMKWWIEVFNESLEQEAEAISSEVAG